MTVKEMINLLLEYPMNAEVLVQKELSYNIWVNSPAWLENKEQSIPIITFEFPNEEFEIYRKNA